MSNFEEVFLDISHCDLSIVIIHVESNYKVGIEGRVGEDELISKKNVYVVM